MADGVRYHIVRSDKDGCPPIPDLVFDDPAEAGAACKALGKEMGEKLTVKPIVNPKWRLREKERFECGVYRPLPWQGHDWWNCDTAKAVRKDHYAHPSIERPGWLAYTKSAEDGTVDRQTIVRPGAYLKQHFGRLIEYYGLNERRLVEQFMEAYGPLEVMFATTEDEIIAVYEHGPATCMRGKGWPADGRNPARIYAAGDLQVAYLGDLEHATARTLVWPEKKTYSRVYGDIARLTRGLERLGYRWGPPLGAKVQKLKIQEVKFNPNAGPPTACFIAPYIDKKNQQGGGHLAVIEHPDHLVICEDGTPGSHHCGLADGYSGQYVPRQDEYPTFSCDECGEPGHRKLQTVLTDTEDGDEKAWCNKCIRHYGMLCHHSGIYFDRRNVEFRTVDDTPWANYYADMYASECEMSGFWCTIRHISRVYFEDGTSKMISHRWAEANGGGVTRSTLTERHFLRRDLVRVGDLARGGHYLGKPELKYHAFECDGCHMPHMLHDRVQAQEDDHLFCPGCAKRMAYGAALPRVVKVAEYDAEMDELVQAIRPDPRQVYQRRG